MALGPRLDLRQTQTLVMTPQLRQAIKLLQYSNVEVASFVEEELERNPLLERDESAELPNTERAAPDQTPERTNESADAAQFAQADTLPSEMAAPLDTDPTDTYDAGGVADGAPLTSAISGRGGTSDFDSDERGIEDMADERRPLRDHLGEQLRLSFADPVDRMIGAHLIALLCPAGRLTADPAAIAGAMAIPLGACRSGARADDAIRSGRVVRARSEGMPGGTARRARSAGSGNGGAARQSRSAGATGDAAAGVDLRCRCRRPCRDDRRDPQSRSEAGSELRYNTGAERDSGHPDAAERR